MKMNDIGKRQQCLQVNNIYGTVFDLQQAAAGIWDVMHLFIQRSLQQDLISAPWWWDTGLLRKRSYLDESMVLSSENSFIHSLYPILSFCLCFCYRVTVSKQGHIYPLHPLLLRISTKSVIVGGEKGHRQPHLIHEP